MADSHKARAVTVGSDIHFGEGQYRPEETSGQHLIAHEVAHTIQQSVGRAHVAAKPRAEDASYASDSAENEADTFADAFISGSPLPALSASRTAVARKRKKDGGKTSGEAAETPEAKAARLEGVLGGRPFVLRGQSAVVSTAWFLEDPAADPTASEISAPTKFAVLLRKWKANGTFWWLEDDEIQTLAAQVRYTSSIDPTVAAFEADVTLGLYEIIGPPPNAPIQWRIVGDGLVLIASNQLVTDSSSTSSGSGDYRTSHALTAAALTALERRTGVAIVPATRAEEIRTGFHPNVRPDRKAWTLRFNAYEISNRFYSKDQWHQVIRGKAATSETDTQANEGGPGQRFASDLSEDDQRYILEWFNKLGLKDGATEPGLLIGAAEVAVLRDIDKHELSEEIKARIASGGQEGAGGEPLYFRTLRNAIKAAERDHAARTLGVDDPQTMADNEEPLVKGPVQGRIINQAGYIYTGLDCQFDFDVDSTAAGWSPPHMTVRWVAHPKGEPQKHTDKEVCSYIDSPRYERDSFNIKFPHEGTFVIHAFVNHEWFLGGHEQTEVEVTTKEQRLRQTEGEAFEGMERNFITRTEHDFETSNFNEAYGSDSTHIGKELRGHLPADFPKRTFAERTQFIADKRDEMQALLIAYKGSGSRKEAVQEYARDYLDSLQKAEARLVDLGDTGYTFFETRGSFLSRKNGIPDTPLHLVGAAKKRGEGDIAVKINDYTRVGGAKDKHFSGSGTRMGKAIEDVFQDLCKSYPPAT